MKKKFSAVLTAALLAGIMLFLVACGGAPRSVMNPPEDPMQLVTQMRAAGWTVSYRLLDGVGVVSGSLVEFPAGMPEMPAMPEMPDDLAELEAWMEAMEAWGEAVEAWTDEIEEWAEANQNRRITVQFFEVRYFATEEDAIEAYDDFREDFEETQEEMLADAPDNVTVRFAFGRTGNTISMWYSISGRVGDMPDEMPGDYD